MKDKRLAASAYIFWIPSLYIVLTGKRKETVVGPHGARALVLWTRIFIVFFSLRFLVNLVWNFIYIPYLDLLEVLAGMGMWGYALSRGLEAWNEH